MRRVLSDIISSDNRFVQEDVATNGLEAYDLIISDSSRYDLIILDINMPKMNGIQLLEKMNEKNIKVPVLIVSSIAKEGAAETIRCLELGAFDFITKPDSFMETKSETFRTRIIDMMSSALGITTLRTYDLMEAKAPSKPVEQTREKAPDSSSGVGSTLAERIAARKAAAEQRTQNAPAPAADSQTKPQTNTEKPVTKPVSKSEAEAKGPTAEKKAETVETKPESKPETKTEVRKETKAEVKEADSKNEDNMLDGPMSYSRLGSYKKLPHKQVAIGSRKLVAIACSTGGPKALQSVIPKLPAKLDAPVVLVQHMPEGFTATLAGRLNEMSKLNVKEAENGEVLRRGNVYIAHGGKHLRIVKKGAEYHISLDDDPARNGLKPCADIMYESLSLVDMDEITCVVLTGMGSDGTRGIGQLSTKRNVYVIAQDEQSSTVYGMPRMVKEAGVTDEVVTLNSVADAITKAVGTC